MNYLSLKLNLPKLNLYLFSLSILLLRLPPLSILFNNPFFNSHSIARYLLVSLLFSGLYLIYIKRLRFQINNKLFAIILFYFIAQSISIFGASNIQAFLLTYKDLVFGILVYIVGHFVIRSKKDINFLMLILLISVVLDIIYQFIIYFYPSLFRSLIESFIYAKFLQVFNVNLARQKYFIDIYDTALIPIIVYLLIEYRKIAFRLLGILQIVLISFFAFVSNFRVQLLMLIISIIGTTVILKGRARRTTFILICLTFLAFMYLGLFKFGVPNSLDRVLFPEQFDYLTIESRINFWQESTEMGLASPLFGMGLGNFYDALPYKNIVKLSLFDPRNQHEAVTLTHPHNLFFGVLAETGFLGLVSIILLVGSFAYFDWQGFSRGEKITKLLIVSFWSLFSFGLLMPPNTLAYMSLFWLLRAMIEKYNHSKRSMINPRTIPSPTHNTEEASSLLKKI